MVSYGYKFQTTNTWSEQITMAHSLFIFILISHKYNEHPQCPMGIITWQSEVHKNTKSNGEGHSRSLSCATSPLKNDFKRCKHRRR